VFWTCTVTIPQAENNARFLNNSSGICIVSIEARHYIYIKHRIVQGWDLGPLGNMKCQCVFGIITFIGLHVLNNLLAQWWPTNSTLRLACQVQGVSATRNHGFLLITSSMHSFMYIFVHFISVHVLSIKCSSSGDRIVLIHHLVWLVCVSDCSICHSGIPSSHTD
jgi:hypothetical protein